MTEGKRLQDLDLKPGDVVRCVFADTPEFSKGTYYKVRFDGVIKSDTGSDYVEGMTTLSTFEQTYPKKESNMKYSEWKIHNGGPCPVSPDTKVEFQLYTESRKEAEEANNPIHAGYEALKWERIICYREVIEPKRETVTHYIYQTTYDDTWGISTVHCPEDRNVHKITFETEDGEPAVDTIKMTKL